jgi:hypothetical protein
MSFDGTWNCSVDSPMGKQEMKITLASNGGQLTGTLSSPAMGDTDLKEGTAEGNSARWKCSLTKPMAMSLDFTAKLDGESLSGEVRLGFMGKAKFTGVRA